MENVIKCYDVVSMVIEEASNQFKPLWKSNDAKLQCLHTYCNAIDVLLKEVDGDSIDVEIDDVKMSIKITIECDSIEICSKNDNVYNDIAEQALSVTFKVSNDEKFEDSKLAIEFVFPSIWDKATV